MSSPEAIDQLRDDLTWKLIGLDLHRQRVDELRRMLDLVERGIADATLNPAGHLEVEMPEKHWAQFELMLYRYPVAADEVPL